MFTSEIAENIGVPKESYWKYFRDGFPESKPEKLSAILAELEKLEKRKKLEKHTILDPLVGRLSLQCIFMPMNMLPEPFNGEFTVVGVPIKIKGIDAIIADPNDSGQFEDAEGLIPVRDPAAEIRNGCKIAVKRIAIKHCAWGSEYYIIDKYSQTYLRRIYQGTKGHYKLVANDSIKYPDKVLHEDEILVVFRVIGYYHKAQI